MLCQGQTDQWIESSFILWCTEEVKRHLLFPIPPVFEFPNQHLSSEEGPSSEGLPYEKCCLGSFYLGSGRPRLQEQISGFKGMNWTHSRKKTCKKTPPPPLDHRITVVICKCVYTKIYRDQLSAITITFGQLLC